MEKAMGLSTWSPLGSVLESCSSSKNGMAILVLSKVYVKVALYKFPDFSRVFPAFPDLNSWRVVVRLRSSARRTPVFIPGKRRENSPPSSLLTLSAALCFPSSLPFSARLSLSRSLSISVPLCRATFITCSKRFLKGNRESHTCGMLRIRIIHYVTYPNVAFQVRILRGVFRNNTGFLTFSELGMRSFR